MSLRWIQNQIRARTRYSAQELQHGTLSFSQCGEDLFLAQQFPHDYKGFYVEVGAFHSIRFSNTYFFYKKGWRGILVEPNPKGFRNLKKYRPLDQLFPYAVTATAQSCQFLDCGAMSAIASSDSPNHITVSGKPLSTILAEANAPHKIDFLSVDCEGHDLEVLKSNDWQKYRPHWILVEAKESEERQLLQQYLESLDYFLETQLHVTFVFKDQKQYQKT